MRATLRPEEKVLYSTLKHWFCLLTPCLIVVGVLVLFIAAPEKLRTLLLAALLFSLSYVIYSYYERKYNIWVVTNMRIIDEWGVLSHNIKESPLEKINNTSFRQSLAGRIFGFGDILIQTAAESGATVFHFVDNPKLLNNAIVNARSEYTQRGTAEASDERTAATGSTKACPMCAENVKVEALKCRFCGHMFAGVEVKADPKPEQPSVEAAAAKTESEPKPEPKLKEGFNPRGVWSKR